MSPPKIRFALLQQMFFKFGLLIMLMVGHQHHSAFGQVLDANLQQCINTMLTSCTYDKGTPPAGSGLTTQQGRKKRAFVNCYADGTCVNNDTPNGQTCCQICKSCTFQNCCHCSFTKPDKYCPIPGWRSSDYTGDKNAPPIVKRDPGGCGDPEDFSVRLYNHAMVLLGTLVLHQLTNIVYNPYVRHNWDAVDVMGNNVRPNDGFVVVRRVDNGLQSTQRVEFMERYIRPEDLRPRDGEFGNIRQGLMESHNAQADDQAGHILANTLGGPSTSFNFFPQHPTVNANRDGRWLMDSWVDTEYAMREYLGQGRPGSYVLFRVLLIYPDNNTGGRPSEIAWAAVFHDPADPANPYSMGGRVRNTAIAQQGPQGLCRPAN